VVLAAIWKQIGFNIIFLIAAFSNVPDSLADQARLDGIRTSTLLTRVYLPLIAPTLVFLAIMNSIFAFFESFALIDLLTQGGPNGATNIMIFKLYKDAFEFGVNRVVRRRRGVDRRSITIVGPIRTLWRITDGSTVHN